MISKELVQCTEDMKQAAQNGKISLDACIRAYDLLEKIMDLPDGGFVGPADIYSDTVATWCSTLGPAEEFCSLYRSLASELEKAYDEEALYIVDQHAAAERINYEKFQRELNDQSKWAFTDLLVPIVVNTSSIQATRLLDYLDVFKNIGIEMSPFGINAFKVTSIPVWMKESNVNEYIDEVVEQVLESKGKVKLGDLRLKAISTLACKASLKANKNLSMQEMQTLLDNLFICNNPFTCPHGRPTLIVYDTNELDKMFKRTA